MDVAYRRNEIAEAERWHFWFHARRRLVLWAIGRFGHRTGALLDVGCGTGFILEGIRARYPGLALTAADADDETVDRAARRVPGVQVFKGAAADLPFSLT